MKKQILLIGITGALACGMVVGCTKKEETTEATTEVTTEVTTEATTEEVTLKTIGTEDENAFQTILTNNTGQDIVSVTVYDTVSEEYCDELLAKDDSFLDGEQRILYYPEVKEDAVEQEEITTETSEISDEDDEKLVSVGYDVKIVLADETEYVLHSFPFGELKEASIKLEDEVAYIENDEVSTKDAELAILEQEQQEQQTEKAATQSAATSSQTSSQSSQPTTQPATQPTSQPVVTPEPAPAPVDQDSENCIGDEGLTY